MKVLTETAGSPVVARQHDRREAKLAETMIDEVPYQWGRLVFESSLI